MCRRWSAAGHARGAAAPDRWSCPSRRDLRASPVSVRDVPDQSPDIRLASAWRTEPFERDVLYGIFAPSPVVEVPPFALVHRKALGFHVPAQELTPCPFDVGAPRIGWVGTFAELVVATGHAYRVPRLEVIQGKVHGSSAVVPGACGRVGDEGMLRIGSRLPEHPGHIPRTVCVVDEQAVTLAGKCMMSTHQCRGGPGVPGG